MIDLSVIILNYNTNFYLKKCLDSIYRYTTGINFEVLVVDNASSDGSPEMVERLYSDVIIIKNISNLGFSRANNLGIRHAKGRYIVLMNSDTELLNNAFKNMVVFMDEHPEAGAVGPRTWSDPNRSLLWCGAKHFSSALLLFKSTFLGKMRPHNRTFLQYWEEDFTMVMCDNFCEVDTIGGHCLMVRRDVVEKCGLLDENFFFYFEDADWSIRMRTNGWKLYHLAGAEIVHHLWKSSSDREKVSIYYKESLDYFIRKHYGLRGTGTLKGLYLLKTIKRYVPFKGAIRFFLQKEENLEQNIVSSNQDLQITWGGNDIEKISCYIFQISPSYDFIPSGNKRIGSNAIEFSQSFVSWWPDGLYFWRVIPEGNKYVSTVASGCILKRHNNENAKKY